MEYDFIVGFTLFNTTGFKTRFRHFDNLKEAIMFTSNVDLKDNSKIYVDLKYLQNKIEEIDFMIKEINQGHLQKYTVGELLGAKRFLQSLLEKE